MNDYTMKFHLPHPHFPRKHEVDQHQHTAEPRHHHHVPVKDTLKHMQQEVAHAVEVTLDTVEKGVDTLDPLHIFSPNDIPTRLLLEPNLFSRNDAYPIVCARSNDTFHNLQVKKKTPESSNKLVIEDFGSEKLLVVMERKTCEPIEYDISMTWPAHKDHEPIDGLYPRAKVIRDEKNLNVLFDNDLAYVISKAGLAASYATKHVIKRHAAAGEKDESVAWTHPWDGKSIMLEVASGEDVLLMYCLAVIAEE